MICHLEALEFSGTAGTDSFDLTARVEAVLGRSGARQGLVTVHVPGSTAAVTTIEFESGALADLEALVERLAPAGAEYAHNARWGDGNGYSHVRAALLGPSLSVPVSEGKLLLGAWQQILLLDFDNRPRRRQVMVQVLGE